MNRLCILVAVGITLALAASSCSTANCNGAVFTGTNPVVTTCPYKLAIEAPDISPCASGPTHFMFTQRTAWFNNEDRWITAKDSNGLPLATFIETFGPNANHVGDNLVINASLVGDSDPTNKFQLFMNLTRISQSTAGYSNKDELGCDGAGTYRNQWYWYTLNGNGTLVGSGINLGLTVVFTLENTGMYPFLVGNGASQKNTYPGASSWIKYVDWKYNLALWPANDPRQKIYPQLNNGQMNDGDLDFNVGCPCSCPSQPPVAICGNGIVEAGEQCDGGGVCCTSTCKFVASNVVCRASAGTCDVAENCTGSSVTCPADRVMSSTTRCTEFLGYCDVAIPNYCDGTTASCHGPPLVPQYMNQYPWSQYNVIAFGNYNGTSGDVEGRLAVQKNAYLTDWSIGALTNNTWGIGTDDWVPYALFVGHNCSFSSGGVYPDMSGMAQGLVEEGVFVGDVFTAPAYLKSRWENYSPVTGDQDAYFNAAKTYYQSVSDLFANQYSDNVNYTVQWGGLFVYCYSNTANRYIATIDGAIISSITWYNFVNCNFPADWVLNINGTGNVTIQGQQLPGIIERAIFNVRGSGRVITVTTGLAGNLLAPNNDLYMANSVTRGLVAVRNVLKSVQNNRPHCDNFQAVVINTVATGAPTGNIVPVATIGLMQLGDGVTATGGHKRQGVPITYTLEGVTKDANGQLYLVLDKPVDSSIGEGAFFSVSVVDPLNANRTAITPNTTAASSSSSTVMTMTTSSSSMSGSLLGESSASIVSPVTGIFALIALVFVYLF